MSKKPPPPANVIRLRGVRHNNLKGFDLDLPLGKLIVVTGLSGSGKSSLAFDTLYAEGQRRYIETFSPYARQFFDRMDKPAVDSIEGIPPAIAIEQRNAVRTTRSTVGTMTEICDHLKVLWPHLATLHCRQCGKAVEKEAPQKVWEVISKQCLVISGEAPEVLITFDLPLSEKLSLADSLNLLAKQGYQRLLVNGQVIRLEAAPPLITNHLSLITVLQDRLKLTATNRARFIEACEQAYHFGKGKLAVRVAGESSDIPHSAFRTPHFFSNRFHCAACDLDYREPSPALFSFNHPVGACPTCKGFGRIIGIDYDLALPDRSLSLAAGAVKPWRTGTGAESLADLAKFCKKLRVPMDVPFRDLSEAHQRWVMDGDPGYDSNDPANAWPKKWYGVKGYFRWLESKSYKMHVRVLLSRYRSYTRCPACEGRRLQPEALLYQIPVGDDVRSLHSNAEHGTRSAEQKLETPHVVSYSRLTLADLYSLPVTRALEVIASLAARLPQSATGNRQSPIHHALEEVRSRLAFLAEVGLGYLTLDRATRTLSGGETERVNLTTCLGTRLVNTLYVLDEPSVGLHPRDTARLVTILQRLRDLGNTVLVVEHEAAIMRAADQIVDLGPGHGETGGELVFQGTLPELLKHPVSLTGAYLSGRKSVEGKARRPVVLSGAESSNNVAFPLTPALSPGEREPRNPRPAESVVAGSQSGAALHSKLTAVPPLPKGEGRGEGKGTAKQSSGSDSPAAAPPPTFSPAHFLTLTGASAHNLKNLTLSLPLARFVCLTGVSGSGKTTLVRDCLLPALAAVLKVAETQGLPDETEVTSASAAKTVRESDAKVPKIYSELGKTVAKLGESYVQLGGSDVQLGESYVQPGGSYVQPGESDIKLGETDIKVSEFAVKLDESGTRVGDFGELLGEFVQPDTARLIGAGHLSRFILVDQTPLGKTPRSNPAVYIGAFDDLRDLFAATELAKQRGLNSSAFSFNSAVGQCDRCRGAGFEKIEMQFLSDVFIKCPACEGRRYRAHILEVKVGRVSPLRAASGKSKRGAHGVTRPTWSIADLLAASVDETLTFLAALPDSKPAQRAAAALRVLQEVGLGYLRLGQPINTLSGGESQRLKLAAHLAEAVGDDVRSLTSNAECGMRNAESEQRLLTSSPTKGTLFIFDEPTTGLHFDDVRVLVAVFQRLVDAGHTVLVIEHNLDVIRAADWLIDLGPEAGDAGGELVIADTPEQVAACERSHTGRFLQGLSGFKRERPHR